MINGLLGRRWLVLAIVLAGMVSAYAGLFGEVALTSSALSGVHVIDTRDFRQPYANLSNAKSSFLFQMDTRTPPGDPHIAFGLSDAFFLDTRSLFAEIEIATERVDFHVVIRNVGNQVLSIAFIGTDFPQFEITPTSVEILPGGTAKVGVIFRPTSTELLDGFLRIASNDVDQPRITIPILGQGVAPAVEFTPEEVAFTPILVGETGTATISITNSGQAPLHLSGILLTTGKAFTIEVVSADTIPLQGTSDIILTYSPIGEQTSRDRRSSVHNCTG
jgi:hypothetical protein